MGLLIRFLLVAGIVFILYRSFAVNNAENIESDAPVTAEKQHVKDALDQSLDQYQNKLDDALKKSGASE